MLLDIRLLLSKSSYPHEAQAPMDEAYLTLVILLKKCNLDTLRECVGLLNLKKNRLKASRIELD